MKTFVLVSLFLFALTAEAQSSYSSANQDTEGNEEGTHLDTGYSNADAEEDRMNFSGEMNSAPTKDPTIEEQEENAKPKSPPKTSY